MGESIFVRRMDDKTEKRVREWVSALVSGSYKQANGGLRKTVYDAYHQPGDGFCCLGVICQVSDPDGWGMGRTSEGHRLGQLNADNGYLKDSTARKYGMGAKGQKVLARMNDSGANFAQIAVFIAEKLGAKLASQA